MTAAGMASPRISSPRIKLTGPSRRVPRLWDPIRWRAPFGPPLSATKRTLMTSVMKNSVKTRVVHTERQITRWSGSPAAPRRERLERGRHGPEVGGLRLLPGALLERDDGGVHGLRRLQGLEPVDEDVD